MKAGLIGLGVAMSVLILTGCSKEDDKADQGKPMSTKEAASAMADVKLQPGAWEMTHEITDVKIDNAPKEMPAGMMQSMIGKKTVTRQCITPEQAANPGGDLLAGNKSDKCKFSNFSMSGGSVNGTMTCKGDPDSQGEMTMTMAGKYAPTNYDMTVNMTTSGMMGEGMTMHMTSHGTGKWIGECPADKIKG